MVIPLNRDLRENYEAFRNTLLENPGIENMATSSYVPTKGSSHLSLRFEGRDELLTQVIYLVDKDFVSTYGLKLLAGKNIHNSLSEEGPSDFLISELTSREAGYSSRESQLPVYSNPSSRQR